MGGNTSKKSEKPLEIGKLCDDEIYHMLSFFREREIYGCICLVSKKFHQLCDSSEMWRMFCRRRFREGYKKLRKKFEQEEEEGTDWKSLFLCLNSFGVSKVLSKETDRYRMNKLFGNLTQQWRLIYRGIDNTFDGDPFHQRVDEHCGTLTVVKARESDSIFGGFTPCKWHSFSSYSWDERTFLFSLKRDGKYDPIKFNNDGKFKRSIYGNPQQLAVFGWGPDLMICQDADRVKESHSNLGESFSIPKRLGFEAGSKEAKTFFACEEFFLVKEMEVFQLIEETKIVKQFMHM